MKKAKSPIEAKAEIEPSKSISALSLPLGVSTERVEKYLRLTTLVALISYICGYIITSSFGAEFGFSPDGIFRPRMLAVGVTFLLVAGLPTLLIREFVPKQWLPAQDNDYRNWLIYFTVVSLAILALFILADIAVVAEGETLAVASSQNREKIWLFLGTMFLQCLTLLFNRSFQKRTPGTSKSVAILLAINVASWALVTDHINSPISAAAIWLLGSILVHSLLISDIKKVFSSLRKATYYLLAYVVLLVGYAEDVYPCIAQAYGGGSPHMILIFPKKGNASYVSPQMRYLISESDNGIYVARDESIGSEFVPKDQYESICFLLQAGNHIKILRFIDIIVGPISTPTPSDLQACRLGT